MRGPRGVLVSGDHTYHIARKAIKSPAHPTKSSMKMLSSMSAQQAQRDLDAYWGKKYTAADVRVMIRCPLVGSRGRWPYIEK